MDTFLIDTHSLLRYLIIILYLYVFFRYFSGINAKTAFSAADNKAGLFLTIALDLQLLIGIYLYFVVFQFQNGEMNMKDPFIRFWKVEHISGMVIAIFLAHLGKVLLKRKKEDLAKFRAGLLWYLISFVVLLASIPWPFRAHLGGRWLPWA